MYLATNFNTLSPNWWPWVSLKSLEMVDVDHQQGQRLAFPVSHCNGSAQGYVEALAIGDPGQRIEAGLALEHFEMSAQERNLFRRKL